MKVISGQAVATLTRRLLIVAWRMLLTGEVYRAVKPKTLARKQRALHKKSLQPLRSMDAVAIPPTTGWDRVKKVE